MSANSDKTPVPFKIEFKPDYKHLLYNRRIFKRSVDKNGQAGISILTVDPYTAYTIAFAVISAIASYLDSKDRRSWEAETTAKLDLILKELQVIDAKLDAVPEKTVPLDTARNRGMFIWQIYNTQNQVNDIAKKYLNDPPPAVLSADDVREVKRLMNKIDDIMNDQLENHVLYGFTTYLALAVGAGLLIACSTLAGISDRDKDPWVSKVLRVERFIRLACGEQIDGEQPNYSFPALISRVSAQAKPFRAIVEPFPKRGSIGVDHFLDVAQGQVRWWLCYVDIVGSIDTDYAIGAPYYDPRGDYFVTLKNYDPPLYPEVGGIKFGAETTKEERVGFVWSYFNSSWSQLKPLLDELQWLQMHLQTAQHALAALTELRTRYQAQP